MNLTTNIPTLEEVRSIKAAVTEKVRREILFSVGDSIRSHAEQGLTSCFIHLKRWEDYVEIGDINFVQNHLRDLGYMTKWDSPELLVSWGDEAVANLQILKDNNVCWKCLPEN